MKNILVTGGLGYIGSHVAVELTEAGLFPVIIDDLHNSQSTVLDEIQDITGKKPAYFKGDFSNDDLLAKINREHHIDGIIHIAAYKYVGESVEEPLLYYENNVSKFVELLKFTVNSNISSFIFSSSAAVYGNPPTEVVTEDTPCNPESPYGWSKYMDEVVLRDTCNSQAMLNGTALRYFNVVGSHESGKLGESPKVKPQNLLPLIVLATAGKIPPITVYGNDYPTPDGTCLRDYIHVQDLAKAHVAALINSFGKSGQNYQTFNIGTGKPTSVLELINAFEDANNVEVPHEIGPRRAGDPVASYADVSKANNQLNWKSEKTIKDACQSAWQWHQKISG